MFTKESLDQLQSTMSKAAGFGQTIAEGVIKHQKNLSRVVGGVIGGAAGATAGNAAAGDNGALVGAIAGGAAGAFGGPTALKHLKGTGAGKSLVTDVKEMAVAKDAAPVKDIVKDITPTIDRKAAAQAKLDAAAKGTSGNEPIELKGDVPATKEPTLVGKYITGANKENAIKGQTEHLNINQKHREQQATINTKITQSARGGNTDIMGRQQEAFVGKPNTKYKHKETGGVFTTDAAGKPMLKDASLQNLANTLLKLAKF